MIKCQCNPWVSNKPFTFRISHFIAYNLVLFFKSRKVEQAAYNSNWCSNPTMVPYVKMMMIGASKPINLSAGGLFTANTETLANVSNYRSSLSNANIFILLQVVKKTFTCLTALQAMEQLWETCREILVVFVINYSSLLFHNFDSCVMCRIY